MIAVIDYGVGNVAAFLNAFKGVGVAARAASTIAAVSEAEKLVLPGVGSFDWAMSKYDESGLRPEVDRLVRDGMPILGVCVGMQMMMEASEEGDLPGLGWLPGTVRRFRFGNSGQPLPHMGWNSVHAKDGASLVKRSADERFYFLHSYFVDPEDSDMIAGQTEYGGHEFASILECGNLMGTQFHPEKSHLAGMNLLRDFAEA